MLRVILEPLIGVAPLVGGVTFFFIRRPVSSDPSCHRPVVGSRSCNFCVPPEIRNQLDRCDQPLGQPRLQVSYPRKAPELCSFGPPVKSLRLASSSLSEEAIMDIIASLMVLPNRMCVPLIDQVKVDQMRFPLPRVRKTQEPSGIESSLLVFRNFEAFFKKLNLDSKCDDC